MKDIITVIKFTMKDMVKRKSFIISTVIILVLIVIGFNVPNIIKSIKGEDSEDKLLIVDNENIFEGNLELLKEADLGYEIEVGTASFEEIKEKIRRVHAKGVDTVCCPDEKGQIDLKKLMTNLGNEGIDSILLEGGGTLNDSALRAGIVKEVHCFIAPKLFGGKNSKTPVQGIGIGLPSEALKLKCTDICRIGEDIRIICQVCEKEQEGPCLQES